MLQLPCHRSDEDDPARYRTDEISFEAMRQRLVGEGLKPEGGWLRQALVRRGLSGLGDSKVRGERGARRSLGTLVGDVWCVLECWPEACSPYKANVHQFLYFCNPFSSVYRSRCF